MSATHTIQLVAWANGPDAFGRLPDGRAVFVPYAIPGETVRVEIVKAQKNVTWARLLEILEPSPDRTTPVCVHFGPDISTHASARRGRQPPSGGEVFSAMSEDGSQVGCSGCHYQHLAYEAQLRAKQAVVAEHLARLGGIENATVLPTIPAPEPLHYRNHMRLSQTLEGQLGYEKLRTNEVFPLSECHVVAPQLFTLCEQIEVEPISNIQYLHIHLGAADEMMLVFESETGAPPDVSLDLPLSAVTLDANGEAFVLLGEDHLLQIVHGRTFRVSPGSPFPANLAATGLLVDAVLQALDLQGGETVLDLYCGVGLFTAFLAGRATRVLGLDASPIAVFDAQVNLDEFDNVELYEAPVEESLPLLINSHKGSPPHRRLSDGEGPGVGPVVLTPPRAGAPQAVIQSLLTLAAPRLVYVACDPASFARDARRLVAGGYQLRAVQPIDMYPQTHRVHIVAGFELAQPNSSVHNIRNHDADA